MALKKALSIGCAFRKGAEECMSRGPRKAGSGQERTSAESDPVIN